MDFGTTNEKCGAYTAGVIGCTCDTNNLRTDITTGITSICKQTAHCVNTNISKFAPHVSSLHLNLCKQSIGLQAMLRPDFSGLIHFNMAKESVSVELRNYPKATKKLEKNKIFMFGRISTCSIASVGVGLETFISPVVGVKYDMNRNDVKPFFGVNFILEF